MLTKVFHLDWEQLPVLTNVGCVVENKDFHPLMPDTVLAYYLQN